MMKREYRQSREDNKEEEKGKEEYRKGNNREYSRKEKKPGRQKVKKTEDLLSRVPEGNE